MRHFSRRPAYSRRHAPDHADEVTPKRQRGSRRPTSVAHDGITGLPTRQSFFRLATAAVAQGDAGKALAAYGEVLARRPRFASAELGRAWALAKLGRKEEAMRALDHAQELGAPAENIARQRAALGN